MADPSKKKENKIVEKNSRFIPTREQDGSKEEC
jgi:hypothetical protein